MTGGAHYCFSVQFDRWRKLHYQGPNWLARKFLNVKGFWSKKEQIVNVKTGRAIIEQIVKVKHFRRNRMSSVSREKPHNR